MQISISTSFPETYYVVYTSYNGHDYHAIWMHIEYFPNNFPALSRTSGSDHRKVGKKFSLAIIICSPVLKMNEILIEIAKLILMAIRNGTKAVQTKNCKNLVLSLALTSEFPIYFLRSYFGSLKET